MTPLMRATTAACALVLGLALAGCGGGEDVPLAIWDLQPRLGDPMGQQRVNITGVGFRPDIGYTVYFGANRCERTTIADSNTLMVATPEGEDGQTVDVIVVADDGPAFRIERGGGGGGGGPSPTRRAPRGSPAPEGAKATAAAKESAGSETAGRPCRRDARSCAFV
jgi:hypothetical protein